MTVKELEDLYEAADAAEAFNRARWVTLEEAKLLYTIVEEEDPDFIFESGTANGFSTMWLSLHGPDVFTFDPVSRPKVWDVIGKPANIEYVEDEFSTMTEIAKNLPGKKLFFIDGLHTAGGVNGDTDAVKEIISPGDVIVYHDLNIQYVVRCWDRTNDFASSTKTFDTRRGMALMVWGPK